MNLYMAGASGTGKTSLANALSDRLAMPVAESVARTSPYDMKTESNQEYVTATVEYQCRTLDQHIVTRTPLDVLGYNEAWGVTLGRTYESVERFIDSHPVVIYLPIYWDAPEDGFRPTDMFEMKKVDAVIHARLYWSDVDFFRLTNESIDSRADHVIEWLNSNNYV